MNTQAYTTTIEKLLPTAMRTGRDTEWSAYLLACTCRREKTWGEMLDMPVRVPERSMVELVKRDQMSAENAGYHVPALELMREGIREGLSCGPTGNGNRFRRRLDALNMGARRKIHLNCC